MTPAQFNEYQRQAEVIDQHKKYLEENKTMTSIEWLLTWMTKHQYFIGNDLLNAFEEAEKMHKQEIINSYEKGEFDCGCNGTGEDYYNKSLKKD